MDLITRLKRKLRNFGISNLMLYIVIGQGIVFAFTYLFRDIDIIGHMAFIRDNILSGEVWRVITFLFMPPDYSILWIILSLYLYYMIGMELENHWGVSNFTIYYLIGVIGTIIGGFITGYATIEYLNLSLFLAYAAVFPNVQFMLFFVIPVKAKYLAYIDVAFLVLEFIIVPIYEKVAIVIAFLNFFIFFGPDFINRIKSKIRYKKFKSQFNNRNK